MEADELMSLVKVAGDDDPKRALAATAAARRELERLEAVQVRRARAQGGTWAEIATALGVSKQAVHKKYGGHGLFRSER
ncbi:helix-turn-helix domain-containing protein [Polymorphospora rubra]|uniref:helix-turn-helix domain-containing protein n=1 Tax=Polymorphospora rubra TaxID=338584 RepID=UPI0033E19EF5